MKLLVLRGDLQSQSGHSAASRDYCSLIGGTFDRVVGVDVCYSPDRPFEPFTHPVVSDDEARRLAAAADFTLVVTYTTPEHYARYPGAANVGLTVWETDRLPLRGHERPPWVPQINAMNALWVQSTHSKQVYEANGVTVPVVVVPWPTCVTAGAPPGLPEGEVYDLDRDTVVTQALLAGARFRLDRYRPARWLTDRVGPRAAAGLLDRLRTSPRSIRRPEEHTLLCVAQDVPRKGLLLFLGEWMEFKRRPEAAPWTLILKTHPADPRAPRFDFVTRFYEHVQALKRQLRVPHAGVYLWTGKLSGPDFERLLNNTHGSIAPSLGEGFCGPAAMALALGKPVVTPRHTAFADYVPPDYPYAYDTRLVILSFVDDPLRGVYNPASSWGVPVPFALARALHRLAADSPARRAEVGLRNQDFILKWCGPARVREILAQEAARLAAEVSRHRAAA